jgi:hypothetical protein
MLAILNLAAHPEHVAPLREEVTEVVNQHGWTKAALSKMRKVDSFLKESARFEGISASELPMLFPRGWPRLKSFQHW